MNRQQETVDSPLRTARLKAQLSPEGLASKAGLSLRTVERIESGEVRPHRATRRVLAAALEIEAADLFPDLPEAA